MKQRHRKLEKLKQRILAAHESDGFSEELTETIGAYCRHRREEGRTPGFIAQELGISAWQVADWSHRTGRPESKRRQEEATQEAPHTFVLKIPLTYRFERLLGREIARSMQKCDSCCWKQFVNSLPGEFRVDREDEE